MTDAELLQAWREHFSRIEALAERIFLSQTCLTSEEMGEMARQILAEIAQAEGREAARWVL